MPRPFRPRGQYRLDPASATTKRCPECEVTKSVEEFYNNAGNSDKRDSYCKPCRRGIMKLPRHAERAAEAQRSRLSEPERAAKHRRDVRRGHLRRRYGITLEKYDALLIKQSGRCAICHQPLTAEKWLPVDHCHKTGKVRGLLCSPCNRLLHKLETDDDWMSKAVAYLK